MGCFSGTADCVVGTHDNRVAGKSCKSVIDQAVCPEMTFEIAQMENSHGYV
jgi:hypothetical protein